MTVNNFPVATLSYFRAYTYTDRQTDEPTDEQTIAKDFLPHSHLPV